MLEQISVADGRTAALEALAGAFRPKRPPTVSGWAHAHRRLTSKTSAMPGPWRNERIPYLAAIMDSLDARRHRAPVVVFVKSSQVGGSECGLNWIGRSIHRAPGSFLALFPTEKVARKWVRTRLRPMLATTPELRQIVLSGRRAQDSTLSELQFTDGVLFTGSTRIPDDVASVSVPYLLFDEVDRMPLTLEGEGDPVELALRRSASFTRRKAFFISTPTTDDASRIWPMWLTSTMDRYFVPCPHCDAMQVLSFDNLTWAEGKPDGAMYMCGECAALVDERHKTEMLRVGEWRSEHPDREESVKGFHVNALYTPIGLGDTWKQHATALERARGKPAKLQVFYNTRAGVIVKSERVKLEWEAVQRQAEPYALRTIPHGTLVLTAAADVQGDRIEAMIVGHGRGERMIVIDHQMLEGDPTRPDVWAALDAYLAGEIENEFGVRMRISGALVDSGFLQHEVTKWTRERRMRNIFAAKGSKIPTRPPIGRPTHVDVRFGDRVHKRGAMQYQIGVSVLKDTLYGRLLGDAAALPADRLVRLSSTFDAEFFRQLCAEVKEPNGKWEKTYERNEVLDLVVLNMAASMHSSLRVDKMREMDWQRLEQLYEPDKPRQPTVTVEPAGTTTPSGRYMPSRARTKR